jgi:aspartyl-tRNA(Asn)/glutamyl-tRNA(Gln) amidotransferase subunit C
VTIDRKVVDHVAQLARLDLSEQERMRYAEQLGRILEYCAKLDELDTTEVEPTSHVIAMTNVFRDDVVETSLPRDAVLAGAPDQDDGFFKVPPVIETEPLP